MSASTTPTLTAPVNLRVTRNTERALRKGQPWVFAHQIAQARNDEQEAGARAVVFDAKNKFLAAGLYDPSSPVRVRVLVHRKPETIDAAFFARRVEDALRRRTHLSADPLTDGYRLIHGPGDGLEGLVVDRYASTLVVKLYSGAWFPWLDTILDALCSELRGVERVVLRLARNVTSPDSALRDGVVVRGESLPAGGEPALTFLEAGTRYEVDPIRGQKTGFFLDQRDNRARVASLSADCDVLNVFSYTGGFSLAAARGGARSVTSIDISKPATAALERNVALNLGDACVARCSFETICDDAFRAIEELTRQGRRFDVVVVDPPAFAKRAEEIEGALQAYERLAALALALVRQGGTLVFASCSSRVNEVQLEEALLKGAARAGARLSVRERFAHAPDHPIRFAANGYLKCLFAGVS